MEIKNLSCSGASCDIKTSGDGYDFTGMASRFNGVDSYGDTILPGAYTKALAALKDAGRAPAMLWNHDHRAVPIGRWVSFEQTGDGLAMKGRFTKGMPLAEDVRSALAAGTVDGLSVGIGLRKGDYEYVDTPDSPYSRIIKSVSSLREVSVVTFPADEGARVDSGSLKSEIDALQSVHDLEMLLRDAGGFSKSAAVSFLGRARVLLKGDPTAHNDPEQVVAAIRAAFNSAGIGKLFGDLK